jgi:GT2 family glycosyltransferase
VSIVIPVRDGGEAFGQALAALARLSPPPHETIVVEDGPQRDGRSYPADVTVVRQPEPRGPAAARNAGARRATGDVLFFLDADVVAAVDAVGRLGPAFSDPGVDAVFGSYDRHPSAPGFVSQFKNLVHHYVHQHAREDAQTFWSGCGAIRRAVFERLGGFDEHFSTPSVEDIELGMRLRRDGGRIRLLKSLQVTHLKRWTLASTIRTDVLSRAVPWTRLLLAEPALPNDLNISRRARAAALLAGLMAGALTLAPLAPQALMLAAALAPALVALDWPLWRFFAAERGWWFALRAMPMQWLYYLYSSAAFLWVVITERGASRTRVRTNPGT